MSEEKKKEMVVAPYENKEGTSNEIGVLDDIGIDMLKNQVVSLYAEEVAFELGLQNAVEGKENYEVQWKIDEELLDMQYNNFGMLKESYTHVIHTMPRFWDLQKEQFSYKVRQDKVLAESQLQGYDKEIEAATNQLEHIRGKIADLTKQLNDLNEPVPEKEVKKND